MGTIWKMGNANWMQRKKCHEGDHMLEEVSQRGCESPSLQVFKLTGHGCEQLAVVDPFLQQGIGPNDCWKSLTIYIIL